MLGGAVAFPEERAEAEQGGSGELPSSGVGFPFLCGLKMARWREEDAGLDFWTLGPLSGFLCGFCFGACPAVCRSACHGFMPRRGIFLTG